MLATYTSKMVSLVFCSALGHVYDAISTFMYVTPNRMSIRDSGRSQESSELQTAPVVDRSCVREAKERLRMVDHLVHYITPVCDQRN